MAENSLIVSGHGLDDEALHRWFADHVCEVILDTLSAESGQDCRCVELLLENETPVAEHRFLSSFPAASVHQATDVEWRAAAQGREAIFTPANLFEMIIGAHARQDAREAAASASNPATTVQLGFRSLDGGGTGTKLWSGGILLAGFIADEGLLRAAGITFKGKDLLELGAGSSALPSLLSCRYSPRRVIATDGIQNVVETLSANIARNAVSVQVQFLDWMSAGRQRHNKEEKADVIMFADCIYTERGGLYLADAIMSLLRPQGVVIGALPDLRVGLVSFEEDMEVRGFHPVTCDVPASLLDATEKLSSRLTPDLVAGGSLEGYRILVWRRAEVTAKAR